MVDPFRVAAIGVTDPLLPRGHGGEFLGSVRLCTWNSQGLFGARLGRARNKARFFTKLAAAADILLVQESHACRHYSTWVDNNLKDSHVTLWASLDNTPVGGLGFAVARSFLKYFDTYNLEILEAGRIAALRFEGPAGHLQVYNVHLNHACPRLRESQLHKIASHKGASPAAQFVISGDFNFVPRPEDRIVPSNSDLAQLDGESSLWDELFPEFHEIFQAEPTRRGREGGSWARLDRIYSSLHQTDLMSMRIGANLLRLPHHRRPLSDHSPVFASISDATSVYRSAFPARLKSIPD